MDIPFYPNTGDGTHCFQAALKMALAVLMPGREFTLDELNSISGKQPGKWTWPTAAMLWMIEQGLSLKLIEEFDYDLFVLRGERYLVERFGEEVGSAQAKNSDIELEREIAKRFSSVAPIEVRVPDMDDLRREIGSGAVVICNINSAALHNLEGYSGHFVVICEVGEGVVRLHDPGLPPVPNLTIATSAFESAWAYPSEQDKNLLSISPERKTT